MQMGALRLFCDIVVARNFTRAAEWNDRTQAHASNVLRILEKKFGAKLIERRRNVFRLTRAGEVVHREFQEILRLYDEAQQAVASCHTTTADIIELSACYSIGLHQLPPCLDWFRRHFPQADVFGCRAGKSHNRDGIFRDRLGISRPRAGILCDPKALFDDGLYRFRTNFAGKRRAGNPAFVRLEPRNGLPDARLHERAPVF